MDSARLWQGWDDGEDGKALSLYRLVVEDESIRLLISFPLLERKLCFGNSCCLVFYFPKGWREAEEEKDGCNSERMKLEKSNLSSVFSSRLKEVCINMKLSSRRLQLKVAALEEREWNVSLRFFEVG